MLGANAMCDRQTALEYGNFVTGGPTMESPPLKRVDDPCVVSSVNIRANIGGKLIRPSWSFRPRLPVWELNSMQSSGGMDAADQNASEYRPAIALYTNRFFSQIPKITL